MGCAHPPYWHGAGGYESQKAGTADIKLAAARQAREDESFHAQQGTRPVGASIEVGPLGCGRAWCLPVVLPERVTPPLRRVGAAVAPSFA
ncbi:hypothetical protein T492DRAFT_881944 [Pavlovales sp. CCMP2436]|nr:hypothetical protein T492DRAFT_881944 [Pavlovales sp. CCMP2436]